MVALLGLKLTMESKDLITSKPLHRSGCAKPLGEVQITLKYQIRLSV